jgi:glycosyltransferase involved in cell wall biosynthesis
MRIGIDGRSLAPGAGRGVARVTGALLAAMAARHPEDEWLVLLPAGPGAPPPGVRARRPRAPGRVVFGLAAVSGRPRLDALLGGVDVVWLPAPAPVALSPGVPSVLTLHDLSWVARPRDFTAYERMWHALARPRRLAERAARLMAVSEATRRDAIDRWGLDPARIAVVAPPVAGFHRVPPRAGNGPDPYFLWVGALEPRKAPDVLEAAWRAARGRGLAARLVVVGEGRASLGGPGVERRGRVGEAELHALYAGALALVLPSRLEGYGLPPLEAARHGTPSVCSDLPALREALGPDGAAWVPAGDAEALAAALASMAGAPAQRARIAGVARRAADARADPAPPADRLRALLAEAARP